MAQITKEELKELYRSMTNKELAKKLGITEPTLISALKRCGIKPKGRGNRQKKQKLVIIE